ncbi:energy transducer TonB family protein [Pelagicoccus albus]|uniref:Energy transducer TonB n=1 Tax=Pelagicoccus albus TaxID=415222 RepID=A0A7X1E7T9_9BACT|nr:energy transducer TonB [Pelagicoccus albus]MBC2605541.1 energy transducer TonB [Pelagicoccus albus]
MKIKSAIHAFLLAALAFTMLPAVNAEDWDEQPSVKKSVAPENPQKITGMVMATLNIDEKGFVTGAEISKSTDNALDSQVLDAVKQWRFNPAKKGGSAIACKINVPFKFKG